MATVSAFLVDQDERRWLVARQPVVAEAQHGEHDEIQIETLRRQPILAPRRSLRYGAPVEDAGKVQSVQAIAQRAARYVQHILELIEPRGAKVDFA
jgi:hypothetical protein